MESQELGKPRTAASGYHPTLHLGTPETAASWLDVLYPPRSWEHLTHVQSSLPVAAPYEVKPVPKASSQESLNPLSKSFLSSFALMSDFASDCLKGPEDLRGTNQSRKEVLGPPGYELCLGTLQLLRVRIGKQG